MTKELMTELQNKGYLDEERVYAEVDSNVGAGALCVNAELVTFVNDQGDVVVKDTVDRMFDITVKSGLFKKTLEFTYNGVRYSFKIKGGKKLLEYFVLIGN